MPPNGYMAKKLIRVKPDVVRVALRLHGEELERVREVQEALRLNAEIDAVRYLIMRGSEALSVGLSARRAQVDALKGITPDAMVKAMLANGFEPNPEALKQ